MFVMGEHVIRSIKDRDPNISWVADHYGMAVFGVSFGYESLFNMTYAGELMLAGVHYSVVPEVDRYRYFNIVY